MSCLVTSRGCRFPLTWEFAPAKRSSSRRGFHAKLEQQNKVLSWRSVIQPAKKKRACSFAPCLPIQHYMIKRTGHRKPVFFFFFSSSFSSLLRRSLASLKLFDVYMGCIYQYGEDTQLIGDYSCTRIFFFFFSCVDHSIDIL